MIKAIGFEIKMGMRMVYFNFLVKTKNVPKGIKCKINTKFFFDKGFPKRGGGVHGVF